MINTASSQKINRKIYFLFIYTFFLGIITYGFALTNFTVSIDNEMPIYSNFGMEVGRWGQNLILYHLFGGHLPYFSIILSLVLFSVAAIQINNLLKFNGLASYLFCGLFITFPQLSYQIIFGMMAVVAALGVIFSTFFVQVFLNAYKLESLPKKLAIYLAIALLLMFSLSNYQAFLFIPITLYLIVFFQETFSDDFNIISEFKKALHFAGVIIVGGVLYYFSVKIICPLQQGGYIESFVAGENLNFFSNFITISKAHLLGNSFYGEKLYIIATLSVILISINLAFSKKHFVYRVLTLLVLIISPFILSYFITNGYHPPRLYVTLNLVFAFIIVLASSRFKVFTTSITLVFMGFMFLFNIYFVTKLFTSANKIYKHDVRIAEKIDNIIQTKYPSFSSTEKSIYFYGYFPYEYHQKYRLENSEIFGGSFYGWDNGNNFRIVNFFKEADIAEYNMVTKEKYDSVKDSIANMPAWPDSESIKMINNVVVVKLGKEKGGPMYFE